jgi:hypothetical protein
MKNIETKIMMEENAKEIDLSNKFLELLDAYEGEVPSLKEVLDEKSKYKYKISLENVFWDLCCERLKPLISKTYDLPQNEFSVGYDLIEHHPRGDIFPYLTTSNIGHKRIRNRLECETVVNEIKEDQDLRF